MKLLLAEDERELSGAIKKVLELNKYEVDRAFDGEQALALATENDYDAVILDVMMPKMDGIEVVRRLRRQENHVPVLILTARAETDDKVLGLDAGADDYLTKPFVIKELLARIRAIARRHGELRESYSFANVTLLPERSEMKAVGSIPLTNKEYRLMEFLVRNRGVLISAERLMERVWEYDSEAEINVVWVFLSVLRKKLDKIGANCTIKAVRGVGYRLEETHATKA